MQLVMAQFVCNKERTLNLIAGLLAADSAALVVVQGACTLKRRVAGLKPCNLHVEVVCGCQDEGKRLEPVGPVRNQCLVEPCGLPSNWLEGVHVLHPQQLALLLVIQTGAADRFLKGLLAALGGLFIRLEEL